MSYINEALKKAQKERDARSGQYSSFLGGRSGQNRLSGDRVIRYSLTLLILILLVLLSYSWLDLPDRSDGSTPPRDGAEAPFQERPIAPGPKELYERAGNLYKSGHVPEAKKLYEDLLDLDPGYVDALNNLGIIYIQNRDYLEAERNLEKAVRLRPRDAVPYYNLACLHTIRGDREKGLFYLKKAISLNSEVKGWAGNDSDLANLRDLPGFKDIIAK